MSENGRLKTRAEEECGNKPRCGLYSPIHVDMDMGVRVVKRPLYTAHVGAGAFLWNTDEGVCILVERNGCEEQPTDSSGKLILWKLVETPFPMTFPQVSTG